MSALYEVTFLLEDWMRAGLAAGKYMIHGGNLVTTDGHRVVKWLKPAAIQPLQHSNLSALSTVASTSAAVASVCNVGLNLAILHKLGKIQGLAEKSLREVERVLSGVDGLMGEQVKAHCVDPIRTGLAFVRRAMVSEDPAPLLEQARTDLVRGVTAGMRWLDELEDGELLSRPDLVRLVTASVAAGSLIEAQCVRLLEGSAEAIRLPLEEVDGVLNRVQARYRDIGPRLPRRSEIQGTRERPALARHAEELVLAVEEGGQIQLALAQGSWECVELGEQSRFRVSLKTEK